MTSSTPFVIDDARREMDAKTKPLGALGRLEDIAIRLAALQRTIAPLVERTRVCVFGADHGIADEGVSAYPRAVTAEMMRNFARGGAAINVLAAANGVDVEVIDVGVDADLAALPNVRHERVRGGTRNFARESAMTEIELDAALAVGAECARRAAGDGVHAFGLGEMGIANTTSAAALLGAVTGETSEVTVGRGTGVDDAGLERKRRVVDAAIQLHFSGRPTTGRDALLRVGGFEIAAIAGAARAAAALGIAVVADGFISTVGVLCALLMERDDAAASRPLADAIFFAHRSAERGHRLALDECAALTRFDSTPILDLGLRLGEGTGAVLAMPILRAAAIVMRDMATFADAGVSAGEHALAHGAAADSPQR
jgi:nicotinate-nucleotide--dimethylbenzimidazole phosphoribosyltransferase